MIPKLRNDVLRSSSFGRPKTDWLVRLKGRHVMSETGTSIVRQTALESAREMDRRLTVSEAARLVGCSDDTIRRGYWSGHLKVQRLGARLQGVRIPRSELERWLADGARTA